MITFRVVFLFICHKIDYNFESSTPSQSPATVGGGSVMVCRGTSRIHQFCKLKLVHVVRGLYDSYGAHYSNDHRPTPSMLLRTTFQSYFTTGWVSFICTIAECFQRETSCLFLLKISKQFQITHKIISFGSFMVVQTYTIQPITSPTKYQSR